MIALKKIRDLDIVSGASNTRPLHLSAASGLVCLDAIMYVVADDELHLGAFPTGDCRPGHLIRICEGALPDAKAERKRRKPDFEALTLIPPNKELPHGALLAVGSGSRPNRRAGVRADLDEHGFVSGECRKVDLSLLLDPLEQEFPETNIEGAVVVGQELRLFQRGNKRHTDNAIIRYPLEPVLDAVISGRGNPIAPSSIARLDLGSIQGVPYCFTDATALPNGDMIFSAVAEDTEDAYRDGACLGAAIGIIDDSGRLLSVDQLERPYKVEGIHARLVGDRVDLLLVTDADNPDIPSTLFSATIHR
ncbi:hypothetical protein CN085_24075 [Sinorhizobium meliloti]|uniref:DUF6929 family protein n=1 Tax=Rhizobium meliloti TaxID=382 RepID=UPI000FDC3898|nr:hypothetical protein [Sinorhizobium meliloti]RVP11825.1 hypothetical protein CN085_24075 [Sinorhizobium meliloti]